MEIFYSKLAPLWPLLSPPGDYLEEAQEIRRILEQAHPSAHSLLELDATDTVGTTHYAFLVREADGSVRSLAETHTFGLYPAATWRRLLLGAGFAVEVLEEHTAEPRRPRLLFLGRRAR